MRQERADRLSGDTGEANRILQEDLEFRQEAQREIDKAKAAGRPWRAPEGEGGEGAGSAPSGGSGKARLSSFLARRRASRALDLLCAPSARGGGIPALLSVMGDPRWRCGWRRQEPACSCASSGHLYIGNRPATPRPRV